MATLGLSEAATLLHILSYEATSYFHLSLEMIAFTYGLIEFICCMMVPSEVNHCSVAQLHGSRYCGTTKGGLLHLELHSLLEDCNKRTKGDRLTLQRCLLAFFYSCKVLGRNFVLGSAESAETAYLLITSL